MTIKKPREQAVQIMLTELRGMVPAILICNGIVVAAGAVYMVITSGFAGFHDVMTLLRFTAGLLLGNAATIGNFCFLGLKAARIIRKKDKRHAQVYSTTGFFIRYFGAFALFGALIKLGVINPYTVVIPLFYPKIHYTVKAIFNKEV
jgi:hypothetical protein